MHHLWRDSLTVALAAAPQSALAQNRSQMTDELATRRGDSTEMEPPQVVVLVREDDGVRWVPVTDEVKDVLDAVAGSMDWGSGFLDYETEASAIHLMKLLEFETIPGHWQQARPLPLDGTVEQSEGSVVMRLCALCGHDLNDENDGFAAVGDALLCHASDHSCYVAWTVDGFRPPGFAKE